MYAQRISVKCPSVGQCCANVDSLADPGGGGERKGKKEKREEGFSLCVLVVHSNLSCIKHSTDEIGFPFITSETIIIIVRLDHIRNFSSFCLIINYLD